MSRGNASLVAPLLAGAILGGNAPPVVSAATAALDVDVALARSRAALGRLVGDYRFTDTAGGSFDLSTLRGKPWVLSLVYTSCNHSCSLVTRSLTEVVEVARQALGEDRFAMVTLGFDAAADSPARMSSYARGHGVDSGRWHFLSGDRVSIERLVADVGFSYVPSPNGFDHLTQTTVVDADGRVYRQLYGDRLDPPAFVEPLKELVYGLDSPPAGLQAWIDRVRALCTIYDPSAGRYRFDYSIVIGAVIGVVCLGGVAAFLIRAWRTAGPAASPRSSARP